MGWCARSMRMERRVQQYCLCSARRRRVQTEGGGCRRHHCERGTWTTRPPSYASFEPTNGGVCFEAVPCTGEKLSNNIAVKYTLISFAGVRQKLA
jgi:hypothetical protein